MQAGNLHADDGKPKNKKECRKMDRKKKFIGAYLAMMGGNKETAEKVYKEQNDSYISAVIEWFERTVKLSFFND